MSEQQRSGGEDQFAGDSDREAGAHLLPYGRKSGDAQQQADG
jgi:hypothetical protein